MNPEAKLEFDRITSKDIRELGKLDIAFLKARRSYLNPAQRLAYEGLNLFAADKVEEELETKTVKK